MPTPDQLPAGAQPKQTTTTANTTAATAAFTTADAVVATHAAATTSTPATTTPSSPTAVRCSDSGRDEALDLTYGGSPESAASPRRCDNTSKGKGKKVDVGEGAAGFSVVRVDGPPTVAPLPVRSFKAALLKPRTFRPRFPAGQLAPQTWYDEKSMGGRSKATVWSRLGATPRIHDGPVNNGGPWSEALKTKAGRNCYNCLSAGHRIADCRDPPRCIICFRFGHKARLCPHSLRALDPRIITLTRRSSATNASHPTSTTTAAACSPATTANTSPSGTAAAVAAVAKSSEAGASAVHAPRQDMDHRWIPGALGERPSNVHAGVARSDAIREQERELEIFALHAVQIDAAPQYAKPRHASSVSRSMRLGRPRLLPPPSCYASTTNNRGMLLISARSCESATPSSTSCSGSVSHARQAEVVAGLFKAPSFIDDLHCDVEKPEEEECLCLWLWTANPDAIPTTGALHIEEPVTLPEEGYADSLFELGMPMGAMRINAAEALRYDVLIHVDRVLDFSAPPASPTHRWPDSPVSGQPDDETESEWPLCHSFRWRLGVPDGQHPTEPERRRISVHDRLGDRDRSPPRGGAGGAGNLGLRQMPPSGPHDLRGLMHGGRDYHHGSSSHQAGGQHRRKELQWRVKMGDGRLGRQSVFDRLGTASSPLLEKEDPSGKICNLDRCEPGDSYLLSNNGPHNAQRAVDPMLEEARSQAIARCRLPSVLQCSVEPPVANRAQTASEFQDGEKGSPAKIDIAADLIQFEEIDTMVQAELHRPTEHARLPSDPVLGGAPLYGNVSQLGQDHDEANVIFKNDEANEDRLGLGCKGQHGPILADVDCLLEGLPFDLNQKLTAPTAAEHDDVQMPTNERTILGAAEGRLNKDPKEGPSYRSGTKTISRFAVPLKKSLLCNSMTRGKVSAVKKATQSDSALLEKKRNAKIKAKLTNQPLDEQANALLMRATGALEEDESPLSEAAQQAFGESFVDPLLSEPINDIRIALGLPGFGQADALGALVSDAGFDDDE
ncbi:unnamed protein product [Urochloa decumbens]|uniref:CCHC-type domain-containing protein n=1 Tax=Urochloa decumbens TaxID=240449 RepID=A0ABC9DPQ8_9POAL